MPFPPPKSCDCHVHVIGPKAKYPLAAHRRYTPMDATADELKAMLKRLGLERVVLVQPSFYGTDNACMLDAMAQIDGSRGVAVLPAQVSDDELDMLDDAGIRGLRVNIATAGVTSIETIRRDIEAAAALCERHGWHVQIFVGAELLEPLTPTLLELPVATAIDHFGLIAPDTSLKAETGPLRAMLRLLHSDKIWLKISGAYRTADDPADPRLGPLAKRLCGTNPDRIVWGSDWPHTPRHALHTGSAEELPFQNLDTRALLDLVPHWLEDDKLVNKVLVSNPARLYGF
jgi:predicted TIM-barrel fold metal-dependent hydrolase